MSKAKRRPVRRDALTVLALLTCIVVAACDADGARRPPAIDVTLIREVVDTLPFAAAPTVAWAGADTLVLFDETEQQVVRRSIDGPGEVRWGREGSGPGEFGSTALVTTEEKGGTCVADLSQQRITWFDAAGTVRGVARVRGMPTALVDCDPDRAELAWIWFNVRGPYGPEPVVGTVRPGEDEPVREIRLFEALPELTAPAPGAENPSAIVALARLGDGRVVVGNGVEYRLSVLDSAGTVERSFGRSGLEPERYSEEDARELAAKLGRVVRDRERFVAEETGRPKKLFSPQPIAVDGEQRLWVRTPRGDGDSTQVDVFTKDGTFLGTVRFRDRILAMAANGGRMAVLAERREDGRDGRQGIDIYRIPTTGDH